MNVLVPIPLGIIVLLRSLHCPCVYVMETVFLLRYVFLSLIWCYSHMICSLITHQLHVPTVPSVIDHISCMSYPTTKSIPILILLRQLQMRTSFCQLVQPAPKSLIIDHCRMATPFFLPSQRPEVHPQAPCKPTFTQSTLHCPLRRLQPCLH